MAHELGDPTEREAEFEEKLKIHLVRWGGNGYFPFCRFTSQHPRYWPKGHSGVCWENRCEVDCPDCLALMKEEEQGGTESEENEDGEDSPPPEDMPPKVA